MANDKPQINYLNEVQKNLEELDIELTTNKITEWQVDGYTLLPDELIGRIFLHRNKMEQERINKDIISMALCYMEDTLREKILRAFQAQVKYEPNLPDRFEELAKFISQDKYEPIYPIILKHIIWTIKRRVFKQSDYCPLFLSVYGAAGCGKSEFLKAMFGILPSTMRSHASQANELFNDERQQFRFSRHYVIVMDELTGIGKTDINKIKNQIDQDIVVYRRLGYNQHIEGRNNAQLMGISNTRLRNTINSDSDIRKWCEIDFYSYPDNEVPAKMVTPLQKYDWLTLWKSVDENSDSPFHNPDVYNSFKDWTFKKCQNESATMMYLQDLTHKQAGQWISKKDIYDLGYKMEVKEYPLNWGNFKEKAEKLGFTELRKTAGVGLVVPDVSTSVLPEDKDNF